MSTERAGAAFPVFPVRGFELCPAGSAHGETPWAWMEGGVSEILDPGKGETDCLGEVWVGEPTEPIHLQGIRQEEESGGR